jgi:hypothetical protein
VPVHAELVAGPVTDLNVMTRRSAWSSRVRRCKLSDADFAVFAVEITMVIALGSLSARAAADEFEALPCDAILMAAGESLTLLAAERGAEFVLIDLWQTR